MNRAFRAAAARLPSWLLRIFRLTRREYFADFFITPPITLALAAHSLTHDASSIWPLQFLAGWIVWTLYEYGLHRWVLHEWPIGRQLHALHHADETDYIAVHPSVTILVYAAVWLIFGLHSSAFAVGISAGYILYAALHSAYHYLDIGPDHPLRKSYDRHVAHHRFSSKNFGVTHSLWDRLFRTEFH